MEAGGRVLASDMSPQMIREGDCDLPDPKEFVSLLERPALPSLRWTQVPLKTRVSLAALASSSLQASSTQASPSSKMWGDSVPGEEKQPLAFTVL